MTDSRTPRAGSPRKPIGARIDAAGDPVATALRRLHEQVIAEPLPDDFLKLLDDIDEKIADGERQ